VEIKVQQECAGLSPNGEQFLVDANHSTLFTKKENADLVGQEIIQLPKTFYILIVF
jgi:hypothetical protein